MSKVICLDCLGKDVLICPTCGGRGYRTIPDKEWLAVYYLEYNDPYRNAKLLERVDNEKDARDLARSYALQTDVLSVKMTLYVRSGQENWSKHMSIPDYVVPKEDV